LEDHDRQSPLKFLAIAASPLILVLLGVLVFAREFIPGYILVTMAVLAAAAVTGLTILVLLADSFRRKNRFSGEYLWLAGLLVVFLGTVLVLIAGR
jgi:hypothetical protein